MCLNELKPGTVSGMTTMSPRLRADSRILFQGVLSYEVCISNDSSKSVPVNKSG